MKRPTSTLLMTAPSALMTAPSIAKVAPTASDYIKKGTALGGGRCLDGGEVSIYQFLRKYMDSLLEPL